MRRSTDNGVTWSEPVSVYQGVNWEPYLLELSSGEIHCYFTDSSRTGIEGKDTGTAMVISRDGGQNVDAFIWKYPLLCDTNEVGTRRKKHTSIIRCRLLFKLKGSNELAAL